LITIEGGKEPIVDAAQMRSERANAFPRLP
jgi:hypothetical protein